MAPADQPAFVTRDPADSLASAAPVTWALRELGEALGQASAATEPPPHVVVAGAGTPVARAALARAGLPPLEGPEAFALVPTPEGIVALGSDVRGLVYAVLELADRARHAQNGGIAAALRPTKAVVERPACRVRSIARLFSSQTEDLGWWHDRTFWTDYLTELVTHRHNRFALTLGLGHNFPRGVTDDYLHFPYPFLIDVPGYDVRARGVSAGERDRNLETLRFIGQEVKRRGLQFQLGLWTHAYRWVDSPHATHPIEGLSDERHAAYCRDALRLLVGRVPTVDGLTFRVHGESGIPEGSHDFWRTVFGGVVDASRALGRPLEIDMHAKGLDQETIDLALETGLPIVISPKYWAEHQGLPYQQASIREIERLSPPARGHMAISSGERRHSRYGYTDLLREDRGYDVLFRIWPGTQRLLLWGDPTFAAGFGTHGAFDGCLGTELCEPLSFKGRLGSGVPGNRTGYADESLIPARDFEKYRYTYRVWGRGTYRGLTGETDPDGWRRFTRYHFGDAAADAELALAHASRICLLATTAHGPSANCKIYWPELYTNQPLASDRGHPYSDMTPPKTFGHAT
ncbi:MAG TPA: hypothetical protein VFX49_19285, partial [Chloroflexota bacterium]|nr:hypothetical protein [Chloroflexota bacterium]